MRNVIRGWPQAVQKANNGVPTHRRLSPWDFKVVSETTRRYGAHLDLDPMLKDPFGVPVVRITDDYKENEKKIAAYTQDKMAEWFKEAGAIATERVRRSPHENWKSIAGA